MPHYVVSLNPGRYFIWSTIVDANLTQEMSREEMLDYIVAHETTGVDDDLAKIQAERRLARVDDHGSSSDDPEDTAERIVRFNRLGPRDGCVKVDTVRKIVAEKQM